ncbi:Penicillin-binding protein 1A [termite gut metagenome]|uniref:peptidoglycan glycosyltransferase n=1 Tax=termite gut metagenome TaxID=433724 RepID=A0A5J4T4T5_9ZZZZ
MVRKVLIGLWILFGVGMVASVGIFFAISKGWIGYMPAVEELENPNYKFAAEIFTADYQLLGTWSVTQENRVYIGYKDLPEDLIHALVATEDIRFSEHSGIDFKAVFRAIIKTGILRQSESGGGSTISQQISKMLYSPSVESKLERVLQKPIEWAIAVKLERYYTKEELLTMYLNKFDFLNNAVGIKTAAYTYFGCEPKELKYEEIAVLVGMCKNPSRYNPVRFNERSLRRRNVVLEQVRKAGYLSREECDSLQGLPLTLNYHRVDHKEGLGTYLREYLRMVMTAKKPDPNGNGYRASWQKQKFYEDSISWETDPLFGWCEKNKKKDGSNYNIYIDGLKIYTTIDSRMQKYAEEAIEEHLGGYLQDRFFAEKRYSKTAPYSTMLSKEEVDEILNRSIRQTERYRMMKVAGATEAKIQKAFDTPEEMSVFTWNGEKDTIMSPLDSIKYYKHFLRTGFMSMDPISGHVKAYVGGPNYSYFQYDMAMVGRRQVGSTIKPYLYTLAMENGFSPCDLVRNVEQTLMDEVGNMWSPRNDSRNRYGEMVTLKWGLANSNNWISAYLMSKLNPYALAQLLHSFGVRNKNIVPTVSLCLGPCEISVGEMVSAYTAFANKGIRVAPLFVTKIEDSDGNVISTFTSQMEEVVSMSGSYKMLVMLRAVINEGTGSRVRRLYGITGDIAGKTGTTNRNADGWFMGITPSLVSGCWVGGEERDIHFDRMSDGQGAAMALPVWAIYMNKVYRDKSLGYNQDEFFYFPENYDPCEGDSSFNESSSRTGVGLDDFFE